MTPQVADYLARGRKSRGQSEGLTVKKQCFYKNTTPHRRAEVTEETDKLLNPYEQSRLNRR